MIPMILYFSICFFPRAQIYLNLFISTHTTYLNTQHNCLVDLNARTVLHSKFNNFIVYTQIHCYSFPYCTTALEIQNSPQHSIVQNNKTSRNDTLIQKPTITTTKSKLFTGQISQDFAMAQHNSIIQTLLHALASTDLLVRQKLDNNFPHVQGRSQNLYIIIINYIQLQCNTNTQHKIINSL